MSWKRTKDDYEGHIENLTERIQEESETPFSRWIGIPKLLDEIDPEELAEILMLVYDQVIRRGKDKEWIERAIDREEKLEMNDHKPGRPSKVDRYAGIISWSYRSPKMSEGYWKEQWREAKQECSRATQYRIINKLKEEHSLEIDDTDIDTARCDRATIEGLNQD